jgi:hypothetical protein
MMMILLSTYEPKSGGLWITPAELPINHRYDNNNFKMKLLMIIVKLN